MEENKKFKKLALDFPFKKDVWHKVGFWAGILTDFFLLGNVLVASCEHFVVLYRNLCDALIVVITIVIIIILIVSIQSFTGVVQARQRGCSNVRICSCHRLNGR